MDSDLHDMLSDLLEYMEDREDADCVGDPPEYKPNREMILADRIREYMSSHE